jgi:hypothetical protein
MTIPLFLFLGAITATLAAADKYTGPPPPKTDVLYILHANQLTETESGEAREQTKKNESTYVISGASSPARTPLSEPIFIVDARQLAPERMELYKLDVKNGNREVSLSSKKKSGNRPLHLMVTKLNDHIYKVEADEPLEDGEYAITPSGDNRVFCFQIY